MTRRRCWETSADRRDRQHKRETTGNGETTPITGGSDSSGERGEPDPAVTGQPGSMWSHPR